MPEAIDRDGSGPHFPEPPAEGAAAHSATISIIECLTKIVEESRLRPDSEQLPSSDHLLHELRNCVSSYAVLVKELNTPPERAAILVKQMVADTLRVREPLKGSITGAIVPWILEAYFPSDSPPE